MQTVRGAFLRTKVHGITKSLITMVILILLLSAILLLAVLLSSASLTFASLRAIGTQEAMRLLRTL